MPKCLYHFTTAECAYSILKDRQLLASSVLTCNDPFEIDNTSCFIRFENEKQLKWFCNESFSLTFSPYVARMLEQLTESKKRESSANYFQHIKKSLIDGNLYPLTENTLLFEQQRANSYLYCFSEVDVRLSILLWSHYAKKHSGVAIEFKFPADTFEKELHKVKYHPKNIRGGIFSPKELINFLKNYKTDFSTQINFYEKTLLTKHNDWTYENEWRFISYSEDKSHKPALLIKDSGLITAVYLGLNIDKYEKEKLAQLIKENFPHTKIFVAKKNSTLIKLDFNELNTFSDERISRMRKSNSSK